LPERRCFGAVLIVNQAKTIFLPLVSPEFVISKAFNKDVEAELMPKQ